MLGSVLGAGNTMVTGQLLGWTKKAVPECGQEQERMSTRGVSVMKTAGTPRRDLALVSKGVGGAGCPREQRLANAVWYVRGQEAWTLGDVGSLHQGDAGPSAMPASSQDPRSTFGAKPAP